MKKLYPILILAFLFRLLVTPLYHHSDADTYFYWAKYLWETKDFLFFFGKGVPNAMTATYPPIYYYLIFLWRGFYELVGHFLWWINLNVSFFPSNLIFWYQSYEIRVAFNKILGILGDIGCGYLIFKTALLITKKNKAALLTTVLFLFLPATWYNSAYWGQIDSLYSFFVLLAFYLGFKDKFLLATYCLGISALIKPTGLFVAPVFLIFALKKKKLLDLFVALIPLSITSFILYFPSQPLNTIFWTINFYLKSFQGELNDIVANAFNFWALIFVYKYTPDTTLFLKLPLSFWGFILYLPFLLLISLGLFKKFSSKNVVIAAFLCGFAAFLFLPRMHERYFFISLVFLALASSFNRYWLSVFILFSIIHFFNLYHFWWYPQIPFLISFLSSIVVIRCIIFLTLGIFLYNLASFLYGKETFK